MHLIRRNTSVNIEIDSYIDEFTGETTSVPTLYRLQLGATLFNRNLRCDNIVEIEI